MSGDIKKEYQRNLGAILLIAAFLCLIIQFGFNSLLGFISSQSDILDMIIVFVEFVLTSVLSALIMSMLSNFLPSNMKYRLVFLKWRDFTVYVLTPIIGYTLCIYIWFWTVRGSICNGLRTTLLFFFVQKGC